MKSLTGYTVKDANDLKPMPAKPTLLDFLRNRFLLAQHLMYAGAWAIKQNLPESVQLACLLHDCGHNIARPEHGVLKPDIDLALIKCEMDMSGREYTPSGWPANCFRNSR